MVSLGDEIAVTLSHVLACLSPGAFWLSMLPSNVDGADYQLPMILDPKEEQLALCNGPDGKKAATLLVGRSVIVGGYLILFGLQALVLGTFVVGPLIEAAGS